MISPMAHPNLRIIRDGEPPRSSEYLEFESGDALLVSTALDGEVLLTVDDVDDTPVPTVRLTRGEAVGIGYAILRAAGARRR